MEAERLVEAFWNGVRASMTDRATELRERIERLEKRCARLGDEWLRRVCREDIRSYQRELRALEQAGGFDERASARLQPGAAQKPVDGLALFNDRQGDIADRGKYWFALRCPVCGKDSETVGGAVPPIVNCGDCLMERVEIVAMEVIGAEPT
jgi:hypothetical protein